MAGLVSRRLAQHFRELDIPLDTIAAIAKERRGHATGDSSSRAIGEMPSNPAEHLSDKAARSLAPHRIIVDANKIVRACKGCQKLPGPGTCPDCPMNDAAARNGVAAMIWQDDQTSKARPRTRQCTGKGREGSRPDGSEPGIAMPVAWALRMALHVLISAISVAMVICRVIRAGGRASGWPGNARPE